MKEAVEDAENEAFRPEIDRELDGDGRTLLAYSLKDSLTEHQRRERIGGREGEKPCSALYCTFVQAELALSFQLTFFRLLFN
jgi:hypothetical protein